MKSIKGSHVLEYKKGKNTSWHYAKLTDSRDPFRGGIIWKVGDGKTIKMWKDNWILKKPLAESITPLGNVDLDEQVETYINQDKTWDIQKLKEFLPFHLVEQISATNIPKGYFQDRKYRRLSKNGWFSTASAIELIIN